MRLIVKLYVLRVYFFYTNILSLEVDVTNSTQLIPVEEANSFSPGLEVFLFFFF